MHSCWRIAIGLITSCGLLTATWAFAADHVEYLRDVKPVLKERCYACHGALKQEAGLRLDTAALAIEGGVVTPGDAAGSILLERVTATDEHSRMPPEGEPLHGDEILAIRSWITAQAPAPGDEQPEPDPRMHWAFQSPQRPNVPTVQRADWQSNPVDAFVARGHEQRGLAPQDQADKRIWLRRVTLDLTGLPPTLEEQGAFAADHSADAHERVVDRLLDSPQYGARWGRHWMDIWRYSDWWGLGAEVRNSQKHIWRWRDWIIESLNADQGYDQMLREMLAADELYPDDLDKLRAGGYLARHYFKFNRTTWLDEVIEHTGKGMLGLTFNCAKCHDHKYDPISQVEYYQFRALFEPYQLRTDAVPDVLDFDADGVPRPFDCHLEQPTYLHLRGDESSPDTSAPLAPGVPVVLGGSLTIVPVELPPAAHSPGLRPFVIAAERQAMAAKLDAARKQLQSAVAELESLQARRLAEDSNPEPVDKHAAASPGADFSVLLADDFSEPRPQIWAPGSGEWNYRNRGLEQLRTGAEWASMRLLQPVPRNFEARVRYVPTGGDKWKSVGIAFDVTGAGHGALAYLSSYAPQPKAQVSYVAEGQPAYPAKGAQLRSVPLGEPHELVLQVRDRLINLTVDGEPSVAYRLPIERRAGGLELVAFDASVQFQFFELRTLPAEVVLREPEQDGSAGPLDPARALELAHDAVTVEEQATAAAEAEGVALEARIAADAVRWTATPNDPRIAAAVSRAAAEEARAHMLSCETQVARAELHLARSSDSQRGEAEKKLTAARAALQKAQAANESPGTTYTALRGAKKTLESPTEDETSRSRPFPTTSTGRRTALAEWMTNRRNPLTARVAVNHIWARHFGRPLTPTVFDFGLRGEPPTHPELLDWLAVEFMDSGWSMKHLHRLITTSQAYRLSSSNAGADVATLAADPENRWLWRANAGRMEAQIVRDSLLHLAGELDLALGGPSIPIQQESSRRSVFYVHSNNDQHPFLATFDDASVLDCYRRTESIVPQQALALENSELASTMARRIAARLTTLAAEDEDFIRLAFQVVLASSPTDDELAVVAEAVTDWLTLAKEQGRDAPESHVRGLVIQALLNHNDFISIR